MAAPTAAIPEGTSGALLFGGVLVAVLLGCLWILLPLMAAIVWAAILAYTTWPLYKLIRRPFGRFENLAAGAMTLLVACAVLLPVLWIGVLAAEEITSAYGALAAYLAQPSHELPRIIQRVPWLADQMQQQISRLSAEPQVLRNEIFKWLQAGSGQLTVVAGGVGRNLGKLFITLMTLFFLYRDGDGLILQCRRIGSRFFGRGIDSYVSTIAGMTRAVVYGLVVTVIAQGVVAGLGYAILGIEGAALLGALTGVLSLLPVVGTLAVWGSIALQLVISGHLVKGIILLLWGTLLIHPTDNVLRPLLIGNATKVPFLLVMLGVLGGISVFGLVGAFVGPVLLAVAVGLWREWASPAEQAAPFGV